MSPNLKRILLSLGLIAVAALAGWGLYWLFFRTLPTPIENPPSNMPGGGEFPSAGPSTGASSTASAGHFPVTPDDGVGPYVATGQAADRIAGAGVGADGGSVQYYDAGRQQFVRLQADGSVDPLSAAKFYGVSDVTWAPGGSKAILAYPDGSNVLYDFATQQQATLPRAMDNFSFDPTGQKLASLYKGSSPEEQWLVVSNPDGSQIQLVEPISGKVDSFQPNWAPNGQVVGLFHETVDGSRQQVVPIGRNGENFRSFTAPGLGFVGSWSPSGERLLYSVHSSDGKPQLYLADGRPQTFGSNSQPLGLAANADQCAFSGTAVYCASLDNPPALVSQYPELAVGQPASLWRVDLTTGVTQRMGQLPANMTPGRVFTSDQGVYVADQTSGRLYASSLNR